MHCPHLPAYIKDMYPATHLPDSHHCDGRQGCLLTGHSATPPLQSLCLCLQLSVLRLWRASVGGASRSEIGGAPSRAICQLCLGSDLAEMGLLHCRLVANGRTRNDYVTSPRLFSADTRWGLRNLMLPMIHQQLQSGGCCQTTNAISCITFEAFGQYCMRVPFEYCPLPDTSTRYH